MYLRTTQRRRKDGSVVRYVQLAHNRRVTGSTQAEVLLNLGREDQLDLDGLRRLVALDQPLPRAAADGAAAGDGGQRRGAWRSSGRGRWAGRWLLDGLWRRLGVDAALAQVLARGGSPPMSSGCCSRWSPTGRSPRARSWPPPSGPAATCASPGWRRWTRTRPTGRWTCWSRPTPRPGAGAVFFAVADLLNLEVDLLFFDTTSHLLRTRRAEEPRRRAPRVPPLRALQGPPPRPAADRDRPGGHPRGDPGAVLVLAGQHQRPDRDRRGQGRPARLAAGPGVSPWSTAASPARTTCAYLRRAAGTTSPASGCATAIRDAQALLSRQGRYQQVRDNLRVKEVRLDGRPGHRGSSSATTPNRPSATAAQRDDADRPARGRAGPHPRPRPRRQAPEQGGQARRGRAPARRVRAARPPHPRPLAAPDPRPAGCHRPRQGQGRAAPGRQVPAVHLRPAPVRRGRRAGLQEPARGRTRLPRPEDPPSSCARSSTASSTASAPTSCSAGWPRRHLIAQTTRAHGPPSEALRGDQRPAATADHPRTPPERPEARTTRPRGHTTHKPHKVAGSLLPSGIPAHPLHQLRQSGARSQALKPVRLLSTASQLPEVGRENPSGRDSRYCESWSRRSARIPQPGLALDQAGGALIAERCRSGRSRPSSWVPAPVFISRPRSRLMATAGPGERKSWPGASPAYLGLVAIHLGAGGSCTARRGLGSP